MGVGYRHGWMCHTGLDGCGIQAWNNVGIKPGWVWDTGMDRCWIHAGMARSGIQAWMGVGYRPGWLWDTGMDGCGVRAHSHVRGYARGLRVKVQPRGSKRNVNRPRTAYMEMRPV